MAREAIKVELNGQNNSGDIRRYACVNDTAITKGTLLKILDPRTASYAIGTAEAFAGIASMDKEASDGSTTISAWTNGVFELTASGAIGVGKKVVMAAPGNFVKEAGVLDLASSFACVVGVALEEAADLEVINVRVQA